MRKRRENAVAEPRCIPGAAPVRQGGLVENLRVQAQRGTIVPRDLRGVQRLG